MAMTTQPAPAALVGAQAVANDGETLGKVESVYVDSDGHPKLVTIESGWHGREREILPYRGIELDEERGTAKVPYPRKTVADAPRTATGGESLDVRTEGDVLHHYGLSGPEDAMKARQTEPAPTPEIARAEAADAAWHGKDPATPSLRRWGA